MNLTQHIGKHFRDVHLGGNWTGSNLKDTLDGVTWQQATKSVYSLNSIATLVFHINYYVDAVLKVLKGGALDAHDKFSFNLGSINSKSDWEELKNKAFNQADEFATMIESLPDDIMFQSLDKEKYGNYFRNLHGIIEHTHYHLGQIALIKKILLSKEK